MELGMHYTVAVYRKLMFNFRTTIVERWCKLCETEAERCVQSVRGLAVFLCRSLLPESYFLRAARNDQLLRYGDAYQLNDSANVKTMDTRACIYSEWCENGNIFTLERL